MQSTGLEGRAPPFFFSDFIFIWREGKWGRKRGKQTSMCKRNIKWLPLTNDLTCDPGMCPDWELNHWPFNLQAGAQSTEPHQPGLSSLLITPPLCVIYLVYPAPEVFFFWTHVLKYHVSKTGQVTLLLFTFLHSFTQYSAWEITGLCQTALPPQGRHGPI